MSLQYLPLTLENYQQIIRETGSGLPPLPALQQHERMRTPETVLHRVAAVTTEGRMVGYGQAVAGPWDPIMKPGHFQLQVRVEEAWRRQGIGSIIYRRAEQFAREHGAVAMEASVGDNQPDCLAWAERRGFVTVQHVFESVLDLAAFDPTPFAPALDRAAAQGFRFTSLAAYPPTDEWFRHFIDFYWELGEDVPGMAGRSRPPLEQIKEVFTGGPQWEPEGVILALDGERWAAMCFLLRRPDGWYYHNMTGVRREYRGRGLGLAVKLRAIEYARQRGAASMRTHNDSTNRPMLTVNERLGFRPQHGVLWLNRSL